MADLGLLALESLPREAVERLSLSQRRVLDLIWRDSDAQVIADMLKLSVNTVRVYFSAIYKAFDVGSRGELLEKLNTIHAQQIPPTADIRASTAQSVASPPLETRSIQNGRAAQAIRPSFPGLSIAGDVVTERVAIFIDGWNFAKATYDGLGIRVDFRRLLTTLAGRRTLLRALYYIGEWTQENYVMLQELKRIRSPDGVLLPPTDPGEAERKRIQQQGFIRMLNRNGYHVIKKPVRVFADGSTKAHLDIELAIDMLSLADHCERMVLVSGDSDFVPVLRAVGMRGVRIQVVAAQQPFAYNSSPEHPRTFPARASDELIDAADEFTELRDLVPAIELDTSARLPTRARP